jgi:glyoxylase-like metal-dependent hydrolase (beta-lactamase superfamily II)
MLHVIDTFHLGNPGVIASVLIELGDNNFALVDCGPENVFESLVAGIAKLGFASERVSHLLLSHIHLDHAGGAWRWAMEFGTQILVHPKGAPHLVDPAVLLSSATRIYGDRMIELWGTIRPVPESNLRIAAHGERLRLGIRDIEVLATPGHARHHNAYHLPDRSAVFVGDLAGVTIHGGPIVPPCPPPDIQLESWHESIRQVRDRAPSKLYVTHFGEIHAPQTALDELEGRLDRWAEWIREKLSQAIPEAQLVQDFRRLTEQELIAAGVSSETLAAYEQANPAAMSVTGLIRYWKKFHPGERKT